MTFSFLPEAKKEFLDSVDYYKGIEKELATDFALEVYSSIERIITLPKAWPIVEIYEIRRCLLNRFPFAILYAIDEKQIYILAVMHNKRRPDYWKARIKK